MALHPCVKSTNQKQAATLARSVCPCMRRRTDSRRERWWRKRVSGLWKVKHSVCASQDGEPNVTILRQGTKSSRPKRCVHCMQDALHSKNIREEEGPSLEVMQPSHRHAQLFALQNSRKEPKRLPVLYLEFHIIHYRITGYRISGCYFTGIIKVMLFVTSVP